MKIRSLLLGSVAAAGLSTGAYAADLGVLTSLDVCDALGLSGLTISSDTNCLQISGGVEYEFNWGDYRGKTGVVPAIQYKTGASANAAPNNNGVAATFPGNSFGIDAPDNNGGGIDNDWASKLTTWLKFVGTADSDFGPAKAVIKIREIKQTSIRNENNLGPNQVANVTNVTQSINPGPDGIVGNGDDTYATPGPNGVLDTPLGGPLAGDDVAVTNDDYSTTGLGGDDTGGLQFQEAYVSIGDTTVIMAGRKASLFDGATNEDADEPFNFLGLFNSEQVDKGVGFNWVGSPQNAAGNGNIALGGTVVQIVSDLGNGVSVGAGIENLDGSGASAGTAVGTINYLGDGIQAHVAAFAGGILDGVVSDWAVHAGFTGSFDAFRFRVAGAAEDDGYWNVLGTAEATFDMFKLAVSGEATSGDPAVAGDNEVGAGASVTLAVTDGVAINLGGRYFDSDVSTANTEGFQVAANVAVDVTETIQLVGEVGYYGTNFADALYDNVFYGSAEAKWAPGGGFTSSLKGQAFSNGAYKATFKAAKTFE